jgi:hypothetical protein
MTGNLYLFRFAFFLSSCDFPNPLLDVDGSKVVLVLYLLVLVLVMWRRIEWQRMNISTRGGGSNLAVFDCWLLIYIKKCQNVSLYRIILEI